MIEDIFYTDKYDSKLIVKDKDKYYSVSDIKKMDIRGEDNLSLIVDFFKKAIAHENYAFYTSGTSTEPKCAIKTLDNLIQEAYCNKNEFNLEYKNVEVKTTTTLKHLFGVTFFLMFSLAHIENDFIINTGKVSYPDDDLGDILITTPIFLEAIKKYKITKLPKLIISAGSKLDNDIFSYLEKYSNVIEIFGSSETGVVAHREKSSDKLNIFKGTTVISNPDKTIVRASYIPNGEVEIQDEFEVEDNKLIFKKRKDRILKIYDKRVDADIIDSAISKNEFINKAYCLKSGDKLSCFATLSEEGKKYLIEKGINNLKFELKNYLKKDFETVPQRWRFFDIMPSDERGKIDKKIINDIFNINLSMPVILDRKEEVDKIEYKLFIYKTCNFFDGHFPNYPIVPGVVQLYLASFYASYHYKTPLGAGQLKRIKFSNVIQPDIIISLKLEKINDNINFTYFDEKNSYSSGVFPIRNTLKDIE